MPIDPSRTSTNTNGSPAPSDEYSLTVGADGPVVLHDAHLVDTLAHFNRENIPERKPHAKGSGAFGHLEITADVSEYTKASFLQKGRDTPMLARFSTVAGELGSPDTWRDVRGFSLKFYTDEGNFDLVGNNTPVFFMRDPMKFPHFIRSQKRLPSSGLRSPNMMYDYWSLSPESAHQVAYLMGPRGIPLSYRTMNGYSSHTYSWTNADGQITWVKYHFISDQGVHNMTADQAKAIVGDHPDIHREDLFNHIADGDYPSWTVKVQLMPYDAAKDYRFNPFDITKVWPHRDYPLHTIGKFTLDRNPENFFAQIEQAAFSPSNTVGGTGLSPDRMLLSRAFAYNDAARNRLGVNYEQLPVNRPTTPTNQYTFDGQMAFEHSGAAPTYAPNSYGRDFATGYRAGAEATWETDGELIRAAQTLHAQDDDFGQAHTLVHDVFSVAERDELVETLVDLMTNFDMEEPVIGNTLSYWRNIDAGVAEAIEGRI
ncbi:catalase [Propionibacterium sp. NM47_B9-13]|jgi:catalase|uniref:Catalase n=1 Tax=Cutibacterium modestum HL044PA1 TaxID=765109 RepID=A0ABP2K7A3_9ACTN|nr:catalase [Cutibacterium modestum]TGY28225.1 catalase [Propionibacterium sp. NM47_B9-13]AOH45554.1 catalase [Cutibacterium modestum]EFS72785.1 catalase [Cutibacterium modestum HL037PA2]EFS92017.1 catalase [Cutibacterium modestum HL044PA1]EFT14113.1 catalase [Cutibacterium modestum HL037PA3]